MGLGDDLATRQFVPARVGSRQWSAVATGVRLSLGVGDDGTLWSWGTNGQGNGQLGLGDLTESIRTTPTQIGDATDWSTVSAQSNHILALKDDGTLWAWGLGGSGQLGNGDIIGMFQAAASPEQVGTSTDWVAADAGASHSLAIKSDGTLWSFGSNNTGALGTGDTTLRKFPTQIGSDADWATIAAGGAHSLAVKQDGSLWAWGKGIYGQLGLGDTSQVLIPTRVGTEFDWSALSARSGASTAIKTDGSLWAWGFGGAGALGVGDLVDRSTPTRVGTENDWTVVDASGNNTLGIRAGGTLWAWGSAGALGLGQAVEQQLVPARVGTESGWLAVSAGGGHSLGVKAGP